MILYNPGHLSCFMVFISHVLSLLLSRECLSVHNPFLFRLGFSLGSKVPSSSHSRECASFGICKTGAQTPAGHHSTLHPTWPLQGSAPHNTTVPRRPPEFCLDSPIDIWNARSAENPRSWTKISGTWVLTPMCDFPWTPFSLSVHAQFSATVLSWTW